MESPFFPKNIKSFYNSGLTSADIDIDVNECQESYSCGHPVKIRGNYIGMASGVQIHQLYLTNGLTIPDHFIEYDENFYKRMNYRMF